MKVGSEKHTITLSRGGAVAKDENVITPTLAQKIAKASKDYQEGRYTECRTVAELESFLDAL